MSADGTWNTTINSPMGAQNGALELSTDGDALTGTMKGPNGESVGIEEGKVDGNALTWKAAITQPMPITLEFDATVDGDNMTGNVKLGAFGNATFTGTRA